MSDWHTEYRNLDAQVEDEDADEMDELDLMDGLAQMAADMPDSISHLRVKAPCLPCARKAARERARANA